MAVDLSGKRAIVTGGTRGIGRAIVEKLLEHGAAVLFCGTQSASVETAEKALVSRGKAYGAVADVSDADAVAQLFRIADERLGGLDILVNNAGIGTFAKAGELSVEQWRRVLAVNLDGVFYCTREALKRFSPEQGGFVVNISSLAGRNPFAGGSAYNASKFGLNGFSEALMLDHRYDKVRVSYIMPGSVSTEFSSGLQQADWKIQPEDVADVVHMVLTMPERTLVSRVEIRPSRPAK